MQSFTRVIVDIFALDDFTHCKEIYFEKRIFTSSKLV
jgi:hypothetical protein